jgi:hypothetical protein
MKRTTKKRHQPRRVVRTAGTAEQAVTLCGTVTQTKGNVITVDHVVRLVK